MSSAPSRISYSVSTRKLSELISDILEKQLKIPAHQRDYVWKLQQQQRLIETILDGRPIPSILVRRQGRDPRTTESSLEDGQQRLTTAKLFMEGAFALRDGKKYADLSEAQHIRFVDYQVPVMEYTNATDAQAVDIFDSHQNGVPLSIGERYHSLSEISPIVKLTKELLMTAGQGFHDRAIPIWGERCGKDTRRNALANAVAFVAGATFGTEFISKKWTDMSEALKRPISDAEKTKAKIRIQMILGIYEEAQKRMPLANRADINYQWDLGHFTAYILYSLVKYENQQSRLVKGWTDYLVEVRKLKAEKKGKLSEVVKLKLHYDCKNSKLAARTWNDFRFELGYLRVFDWEDAERVVAETVEDAESDSYESDESE